MDAQTQLSLIRLSTCASLKGNITPMTTNGLTTMMRGNFSTALFNHVTSNPRSLKASETTNGGEIDDFPATASAIGAILTTRLIPVLCAVGLIGNIATLVLLATHGLRRHLGRMEKFASSGLAVLAVADAMFCLSVHPLAFVPSNPELLLSEHISFRLLYSVYNNAVINTCIATSTWITVTLAIVRYIAVCHPLWARYFIGPTAAARFFAAVVVSSIVLNVPRFFIYRVETISCPGSTYVRYVRFNGWLRYHPWVEIVYWWVYAMFGALFPFCLLAFANFNLIRALRKAAVARAAATASPSCSLNRTGSRRSGGKELGCHVTLTLVVVVALYLVLVTPAEVLNVLRELFPVVTTGRHRKFAYNLCVEVVNTLQAANFSLNFLVYCIINVHFRNKVTCLLQTICCLARRSQRHEPSTSSMVVSSTPHHYRVQMVNLKTMGPSGSSRFCEVTNVKSTHHYHQSLA